MFVMLSSCAIHNKFPFICFNTGCVKKQYSMKPLKKKMQIAINGRKKKIRGSQSSSNDYKKPSGNTDPGFKNKTEVDTIRIAIDSSIIMGPKGISFALMDTVIRIYYEGLSDSVLNKYKNIIQSFVIRTGTNYISEISLIDYYSEEGFTELSVKSEIGNYLLKIGISKHRLFWTKNKRIKPEKGRHRSKKLLYLEIRFH